MSAPDTACIIEDLHDRWVGITDDIPKEVQEKWWEIIKTSYTEGHRKYHNLIHLHKMFQHYDECQEYLQDSKAVCLAVFFHDLHYNPSLMDNEEKSIESFRKFIADANENEESPTYKKVVELIVLTVTHSTEEHKIEGVYGTDDKHYFLDLDLSILGSNPEDYDTYAQQIQEEYNFFPLEKYKFLRAKVLKSFLQIPNIFATKMFREKYEQQARENIQKEIDRLQS